MGKRPDDSEDGFRGDWLKREEKNEDHCINLIGKAELARLLGVTQELFSRMSAPADCPRPYARIRGNLQLAFLARRLGLTALAARSAGTLSYGDVAMLEIGMAMISEPSLLLLDEPTCGMSPAETSRAVAKIRDLAHSIDVIIIEHDMDVVFGIADDITVLAQGAILASGKPAQIASDERVREAYLGRPEDEDFVEEAVHA